jgi:GMP synthase (glutamine-hydrolysing)
MKHACVLVLDYGSQYTQLITRRLRELGVYSVILPPPAEASALEALSPQAVILSGGPNSVYDPGAPQLPKGFLEFQERRRLPVLGICYGMQLLAQAIGGKVTQAARREYGRMGITVDPSSDFFGALDPAALIEVGHANSTEVWMSHGDEISQLPTGFRLTAKSHSGSPAAMEDAQRRLFGLQFHPEVAHTALGREMLKGFILNVCKIQPDWKMTAVIEEQVAAIRGRVAGKNAQVLCGLSGGVDSTVAAVLVHQAIGEKLHCVFVDHGLLRYQERERVMALFRDQLHLPVRCVDASARFLQALQGVTDPEQKRKIIGREFIAAFEEASAEIEKELGTKPSFLVQGTLYPDVIESSAAPGSSGAQDSNTGKHSKTIKSHHNVGGLPEGLRFELIEPFRELFKDEVREIGRCLGVPEAFIERHPFPGPGLAVRVLGEVTPERLEILRHADEIYIQALRDEGLYSKIWQAFAVFLPIQTVGVQGDGRTHDFVVGLRAVTSSDGMTAEAYGFDPAFLSRVSSNICNEVRGVSRVVLDITSKPPATIEWE